MRALAWLIPFLLLSGVLLSGEEAATASHALYFTLYCLQGNTEAGSDELFARVSHAGQHEETDRHDHASESQCNAGAQIDSLVFDYEAGANAQIDVYEDDPFFDDTIDAKPTIYGSGCHLSISFGATGYTVSGGPTMPYLSRLYAFGDGEGECSTAGGVSFTWLVHDCCTRN